MNFVKRLVIYYILTFLYGIVIAVIPLFNPYFFFNPIFPLLIFLFYALITILLGFTILYVYLLFTKNESDPIKCYNKDNYRIFCSLCDYYLECKEKKTNE